MHAERKMVEHGEDFLGVAAGDGVVLWNVGVDAVELERGVSVWGLGVWRSDGGVDRVGERAHERERFYVG